MKKFVLLIVIVLPSLNWGFIEKQRQLELKNIETDNSSPSLAEVLGSEPTLIDAVINNGDESVSEKIRQPQPMVSSLPANGAIGALNNRAPILKAMNITSVEDKHKTFSVSASDPDSDPLTLSIKRNPHFGTIEISNPAKFELTYAPRKNYFGKDSLELAVTDIHGTTTSALLSIDIKPVNDIPLAKPDSVSAEIGKKKIIDVLKNDRGLGDGILADGSFKLEIASQPNLGKAEINSDGTISYTATSSTKTSDTFTYKITDQTDESAVASVTVDITDKCQANCKTVVEANWGKNDSDDIIGYYLYHGKSSRKYTNEMWIGDTNSFSMEVEAKGEHFFALKALNSSNLLSDYSEEITFKF